MEETKKQEAGQALSGEQVAEVAGGTGTSCTSTATVGTGGVGVTNSAPTPGEAMTGIYDGLVEVTSHVIETVAKATR
jgi:hypothetical protein